MTQFTPGLIIEILLVLLLAVTVGYCMILNRRLGTLRSSQSELRQIVFELASATQTAETAIRGLKATTDDAETRLAESLHKAQLMARELTVLIDGSSTKPALPEPPPQPLMPSQIVAPVDVPVAPAPQAAAPPPAPAAAAPRPAAVKRVAAKPAAAKAVARKPAAPKPVSPKVSAAQSMTESDAAAKERALWRQRTLSKLKNAG